MSHIISDRNGIETEEKEIEEKKKTHSHVVRFLWLDFLMRIHRYVILNDMILHMISMFSFQCFTTEYYCLKDWACKPRKHDAES